MQSLPFLQPLHRPPLAPDVLHSRPVRLHHELHRLGLREAVQEATGALQKTFPARFPMLHMDRIYYRNLSLVEAGCAEGLHWRGLSDHSPLRAEFHTLDGRSAL